MRPILAVAVAVAILGGLQFYMSSRPTPTFRKPPPEVLAEGKFDLELTMTFDAEPDQFAFDPAEATAVSVMFEGEDLIRRTETVQEGKPFIIEDIQGIEEGRNEFFVEATPKDAFELKTRVLRLRILRDGVVIGDHSLWSEPGTSVAGTVVIDTPNFDADSQSESAHDTGEALKE